MGSPATSLVLPLPDAEAASSTTKRPGAFGEDTVQRRRRATSVAIGRFLAATATFTAIWLAVFSLLPMLFGWTPLVISSGSMRPVLPEGSVVHIDPDFPLDALGPGSVITFNQPGRDLPITHRVADVERLGGVTVGFVTKGDANQTADSALALAEDVDGVARLVVPFAGLPSYWAGTGQWIKLGLVLAVLIMSAAVTIDTILFFLGRPTLSAPRQSHIALLALPVLVMSLGIQGTAAAWTATDMATGSFTMTNTWLLDSIDLDSPVAHWRLGEAASGPVVTVLTDDFESFSGYTDYGSGSFVGSTAQARSGVASGLKTGNNDPNGGWKALPSVVNGTFTMEVWVYRPSGFAGGSIDRLGIEDSSFNGYSFNVDHNNNRLRIDRRTGGAATTISPTVTFDPPEDAWYRLELERVGSSLTLNAYDGGGSLLASTTATDATTNSFDRFVVHGGYDYFVDDLTVTTSTGIATVAADRIGTLDGTYLGAVTTGLDDGATGDADTAARFDGLDDLVAIGDSSLINTSNRDERTVELWFEADDLSGRQILYEEGGTVNGMNIYLDGSTLYATAWSDSTAWSNDLVASTTVTAGTPYHVGLTLDADAGRELTLYVDGIAVSSDTKTDAGLWNAHSDDGAIAGINGGTRFHDGNASGGGYNFAGVIDEVVLYNTVVSAAQIANHAQAGA